MRTRVRLASVFGLALLLPACTSLVGVGIVAGVTGAAVLAADCSDFIDITVRDGVTGGRTCDATVTAFRGDEQEQVMPCYHVRLSDGAWQLRASLPGRADAVTPLQIKREGKCGRTVQSVELWLQPLGGAPASATTLVPSAPVPSAPPASPAPLPPPPPAPPATQTSAPAPAPAPSATAPAPAPSTTAPAPKPPAAPAPKSAPPGPGPVKRFPDAVPGGK